MYATQWQSTLTALEIVMTAVANAACQAFSVQLADSDCGMQNPTHVSSVLKLSEHI